MKIHRRLILPLFAVAAAVSVIGTAGVVLLVRHSFRVALATRTRQMELTTRSVLKTRSHELQNITAVLAILDGPAARRIAAWKHPPVATALLINRTTGVIESRSGEAPDAADVTAIAAAAPAEPLLLGTGAGVLLASADPDRNHPETTVVAASRLDEAFVASLHELLQGEVELLLAGRRVAGTGPAQTGSGETRALDLTFSTAGGRAVTIRVHAPAGELVRAERRAIAISITGGTVLLALALLLYGWTVERALRSTQEQLVHSAKLSTVGQLIAGVSHELNNPLLGLIGAAEVLAGQLEPADPRREQVDLILKEGRRLKRILADLRGFIRPSVPDRMELDLNMLISDVLELVRHQAAGTHVVCETALTGANPRVIASPDQLRQVFLNLAVNALEAMPNGGRLTISTALNGGLASLVSIADTGTGLPAAARERATEPFFTTKPGRLGLGLAICRDIVEAHRGRLRLQPVQPGPGTLATVELPVVAA